MWFLRALRHSKSRHQEGCLPRDRVREKLALMARSAAATNAAASALSGSNPRAASAACNAARQS
jgi:hypothetical protein